MVSPVGVGIDYENSQIRFLKVRFSSAGQDVLEAAEFPLPGMPDENLCEHTAVQLKEFLKKRKIKITKAVVGVTGDDINYRYLHVPASYPEWRLRQLAKLQWQEISENSTTSLAYNSIPLQVFPNAEERVLLVTLIRNSRINSLQQFFQMAGIQVEYFVPKSLALYHYGLQLASEEHRIYLASVGEKDLELSFLEENNLLFVRNLQTDSLKEEEQDQQKTIAMNREDLELVQLDLEESDNATINETITSLGEGRSLSRKIPDLIEASSKFAQVQLQQKKLQPNKIFVAGPKQVRKLFSQLQSRFGCPVVEMPVIYSLAGVTTSTGAPENYVISFGLAQVHARSAASWGVCSEQKRARELFLKSHLFEYAAILVLAVTLVFSVMYALSASSQAEEQAQQLEKKYQLYEKQQKKIQKWAEKNQQLQQKISVLERQLKPNKLVLETLAFLSQNTPVSMSFNSILLDETRSKGEVVLRLTGIIAEAEIDPYTILRTFYRTLKSFSLIQKYEEKDPILNESEGELQFELRVVLDYGRSK